MNSADPTQRSHPFVSVVVPVLNEERFIDACLQAIRRQDYPASRLEIIVVDGMSTDRTAAMVRRHADEDPRIRLLQSPRRRTPFSMNIGLAAARGEVLVRIDGHSVVPPDHVRHSVAYLRASGADHIGGVMRATGRTYPARAIALAMSSPFGVGNAQFRYTRREQDVDTVPFGAYRRDTIIGLHGFDERFVIGQDSELDFRIVLQGGRVRVTPAITTDYYCRDSLAALWRQFFRYGRAKARILHKHHRLPSARALVPALFVTVVLGAAVLAPCKRGARLLLAALLLPYLGACLLASALVAARHGWRFLPLLPAAFGTLHVAHGCGFLSGVPALFTPRRPDRLHGDLVLDGVSHSDHDHQEGIA